MNDPLHDQVPHMVPAQPDWAVGPYEAFALALCLCVLIIALIMLLT